MKNDRIQPLLVSARTDEDGDTHAIYKLPHAIPWMLKHFDFGEDVDSCVPPVEWQQPAQIDKVSTLR